MGTLFAGCFLALYLLVEFVICDTEEKVSKKESDKKRNETFWFIGFCLGKLYSFKLVAL